jgi:2-C-methyl-D-erythritol 4-phosphate cytidylyltransferase
MTALKKQKNLKHMKSKCNSFNGTKHSLIVVAAGKSERFGKIDKLLFEIKGMSVIAYGLKIFIESQFFSEIIIVYRDETQRLELSKAIDSVKENILLQYVPGGENRQKSVANGLAAVSEDSHYVWIHDGARPFVHSENLSTLKKAVEEHGAAVLAHRITNTIKRTQLQASGAYLLENIDRSVLWAMETPQCFERELILRAHNNTKHKNFTDDTTAVSYLGHSVFLVENHHPNPKLTRVADKGYFKYLSEEL